MDVAKEELKPEEVKKPEPTIFDVTYTAEEIAAGKVQRVRVHPDPVLRTVCASVFDPRLERSLVLNMLKTVQQVGSGIGLAAPQVGETKRLLVMKNHERDVWQVFFNPEILAVSGEKQNVKEGCLSIPGVFEIVRRPAAIRIRADSVNGERAELILVGLDSTCFQHEYDHLDGIEFINRVHPMKIERIKKQLKKRAKIMRQIEQLETSRKKLRADAPKKADDIPSAEPNA